MKLQVLGAGCAKCELLFERVKEAATEIGIADVEKVEDIPTIVGYGVMLTPALAIDGEVKFQGKVPSVENLKDMLESQ